MSPEALKWKIEQANPKAPILSSTGLSRTSANKEIKLDDKVGISKFFNRTILEIGTFKLKSSKRKNGDHTQVLNHQGSCKLIK